MFRTQTGTMQAAFLIMGAAGVVGAVAAFLIAAARRDGGTPAVAAAA